ncbi:hypothetical protein [Rivularia sp. UHCC 0363]|uniref:hypothetical protein n=1 Tax=Rivularia sp. UHCC 0363 TaxID=3110244 RepID=UPI002B20CCE8|nr:hypothetical protein [Rivularia sp. UHCC 0363]MEA5598688.1 hypothetical protein [Rivularia sp. UHCC 0363]
MSIRTNSCPCCGSSPLRHIRNGELYWFCQNCWQEVPILSTVRVDSEVRTQSAVPSPVVKS